MTLACCSRGAATQSSAPALQSPVKLPPPAESPSPPFTRVWLRVNDHLRSELGPAFAQLPRVVSVEILPNGSLRPEGGPDILRIPADIATWPNLDAGLGLFVERPVALHLGAPDGTVIGTAYPGAYLPVTRLGAFSCEVALPGYAAYRNPTSDPLRVFVESTALGMNEERAPADGTTAPPDFRDQELYLRTAPGDAPFSKTPCGPLRVVDRRGEAIKVAELRDGIEVAGWIDGEPHERRGEHVCPPRVLERSADAQSGSTRTSGAPEGYASFPAEGARATSLSALVRRGGALFWLVSEADGGARCVEGRVKPLATASGKTELRFSRVEGGHRTVSSFAFDYTSASKENPSSVVLTGPTWKGEHGSTGVALCSASYTVVGSDRDQIALLRGDFGRRLLAYHPDDTEVWFFRRSACQKAAAIVDRASVASGDHIHKGC